MKRHPVYSMRDIVKRWDRRKWRRDNPELVREYRARTDANAVVRAMKAKQRTLL